MTDSAQGSDIGSVRRPLSWYRAAASSMSDQQEPERRSPKVVPLPRRPRRVAEPAPPKQWRPEYGTAYDPAPTRPVMRSELERETGSWPVSAATTWGTTTSADSHGNRDGSVVDLDERRKRTGDADPAVGNRRLPKPRRIGERSDGDRDRDDSADSPPTHTRSGRHRK